MDDRRFGGFEFIVNDKGAEIGRCHFEEYRGMAGIRSVSSSTFGKEFAETPMRGSRGWTQQDTA